MAQPLQGLAPQILAQRHTILHNPIPSCPHLLGQHATTTQARASESAAATSASASMELAENYALARIMEGTTFFHSIEICQDRKIMPIPPNFRCRFAAGEDK
jgi:hypothetical protein